jgi:L-threonylcarbamoyladenylate synthase
VVALPTETVYGLAANAFNEAAVRRIYQIKGRPSDNPIIVHVSSLEQARSCVLKWPPIAQNLADAFWPGPLTLVLQRSSAIPDVVTAGGPTVGLRWPSHPLMLAVLRECGFPLAAPSANRAGELSPTNALHVWNQFHDTVPLIVDGGQAQIGIESTVLDLSVWPPRVLRPGMIHAPALLSVTGELAQGSDRHGPVLKSPGLLTRHYSPRAALKVWSWNDIAELKSRAAALGFPASEIHVVAHTHLPGIEEFGRVSVVPRDAEAFARALYSELHRCDELGASIILVEKPPESEEWAAISDRLSRASAGH